jgi:hypothetical protein
MKVLLYGPPIMLLCMNVLFYGYGPPIILLWMYVLFYLYGGALEMCLKLWISLTGF